MPVAGNILADGTSQRTKVEALRMLHVEINRSTAQFWLPFDVDKTHSAEAWEDANLPPPTFVVENTTNGHAHMAWRIAPEVARHDARKMPPLRYAAAVQRGICKRLGADPRYAGFLIKNPLNKAWRVAWIAPQPYTLGGLAKHLSQDDMRDAPKPRAAQGLGRNVDLFDDLRRAAYRLVLPAKQCGRSFGQFQTKLLSEAALLNAAFEPPMRDVEVRGIARSVAGWVWDRFDAAGLSRRQSTRGRASGAVRLAAAQLRTDQVRTIYLDMVREHVRPRIDRAVGEVLGIPASTVRRYVAKLKREGQLT